MYHKFNEDSEIYYHRETLVLSSEKRKIDLITISSYKNMLCEKEKHFNTNLFPYK